ncbi:MAG: hypothetical protein HYZ27_00125, partial [Deltaproteobacteria bacterium]|nr:hypothetical protein [Deltaproteobacteria bacterium]
MAALKKQRIGDLLVARGILTRQVAEATAVERVLSDTRFASTLARKGRAK